MKTHIAAGTDGDKFLTFWCPGCEEFHGPRIEGRVPGSSWTWNGDRERPTISPSILVSGTQPITDDEHARIMRGETVEPKPRVCHSFVQEGRIQFLSDCTHALAGQTVDMPDWPD